MFVFNIHEFNLLEIVVTIFKIYLYCATDLVAEILRTVGNVIFNKFYIQGSVYISYPDIP